MNLRSYLKRQTLPKIPETRKEKEESTLLIKAFNFFLNRNSSKLCGNVSKKRINTSTN